MKKIFSIGIASLMVASVMTGCASTKAVTENKSVSFDFNENDSGFIPIFADYPNSEDAEEFFEFQYEYGKVPVNGAGNGIFISGNNHSADLFMGYVKMLDGFKPGESYHFSVSFKLATDVEAGLAGIGGSPGESVAVKCGITTAEPQAVIPDDGFGEYIRMNIDTGAQLNDGKDMVVAGNMEKAENNHPGAYEFKEFEVEIDAAANENGTVYLIIGTDSGYEATTSYYLDDISVSWGEME